MDLLKKQVIIFKDRLEYLINEYNIHEIQCSKSKNYNRAFEFKSKADVLKLTLDELNLILSNGD